MYDKVTEGVSRWGGVSGHTTDFPLFSKRTATGPSCGKSIHVPHLRALRGCSLVSSKLLKSRKSAVCPETPSITLPLVYIQPSALCTDFVVCCTWSGCRQHETPCSKTAQHPFVKATTAVISPGFEGLMEDAS